MHVPSFIRPPGEPSEASTVDEVAALATYIAAPKRERPVVVVTARKDQPVPYFPVQDVQRIVDRHADVVAIRSTEGALLTDELDRKLPPGMAVFNGGGRIFWPFKRVGRSHEHHPIVLADRHPTASPTRLQKLEARWHHGPDAPPTETTATSAPADASTSATRHRPARPPAAAASAPSVPAPTAPTDARPDLRLEVTRAWLTLLPEPADRNRFALHPYRVDHHLTEQLEVLPAAVVPVAEAIARLASGYAWTEVAPVPERVLHDGAPVLRRHDHAVAWRYPLTGSELHLYYWQPAGGPIILARFAERTLTTLPNIETRQQRPTAPAVATQAAAAEPPASDPVPSETPQPRRRTRDSTVFAIPDEQIVDALRRAGEPVAIARLRELLEIPETIARERVRRVLSDIVDRGVIGRSGVRGGVRYFLP